MRYAKPSLSIPDQSALILERGLLCDDPARLQKYLSTIGYYRLSAYWHPFELPSGDPNTRNHKFKPGTTFDKVLGLYIFDRNLRILVMEAMERIEVATRSQWANALAVRHGSHAYMMAINPGSSWTKRVMTFVEPLGGDLRAMGFPEDWRDRDPWRTLRD
jgi:abortive infection bacteriophage resistance protein